MKKYFYKIFLTGFCVWVTACGHSESLLPGSQDSPPPSGGQSAPGISSPALTPISSTSTFKVVKDMGDFFSSSQRLNAGASYLSPLTAQWQQTFVREMKVSGKEMQELYRSSIFDRIFRLDRQEIIDWHNFLPKIWIEPWFNTTCQFCKFLKNRSLGTIKQFLTAEHTAPAAVGDGSTPAVAFDPVNRNYLVAWDKDDGNGEFNIYARLFSEAGVAVGSADKKISTPRGDHACLSIRANGQLRQMGLTPPAADRCKANVEPAVAYNNGNFLITWTERGTAPSPSGATFSVILGEMVRSGDLQPSSDDWNNTRLLSKFTISSADPAHAPRSDAEVQAWSHEEHSHVAVGGNFLLVWDSTKDFTNCREAAWRSATSIYGRSIPVDYRVDPPSNHPNPDAFPIYKDPSTAAETCAPDADVTRGRKPRAAFLAKSDIRKFLVVFETYKNISGTWATPSVSGSLVSVGDNLVGAVSGDMYSSTTMDDQVHEGCFDPDVVATADRFLVVDSGGNSKLKLTPIMVERGSNLTVGDVQIFTPPDAVQARRPRVILNRVVGQEGGTHIYPALEHNVAYEAQPTAEAMQSQIQVVTFSDTLSPMEPKDTLTSSYPTNVKVALASAERKMMAVWNGSNGTESKILRSIVTLNPTPNQPPTAVIDASGHPEDPIVLNSGETVMLSGAMSQDEDTSSLVYRWRQTSTPFGRFDNSSAVQANYTAPNVASAQNSSIELVVIDSGGISSTPVARQITILPPVQQNTPPHTKITLVGGDGMPITTLTVDESLADFPWTATRVTLSGETSDVGETTSAIGLSYHWEQIGADVANNILVATDDPNAGPDKSRFSFWVPDVPMSQGPLTVTIRLTVDDNSGATNATTTQDLVIPVNDVNHHPTAPVLLGPTNGLMIPPTRAALSWQRSIDPDVDSDGDQIVYDVFVGQNDGAMRRYDCTGGALRVTHCVIPDLIPNTTYHWKVWALDSQGAENPVSVSGIRSFVTQGSDTVLARWTFDDGPNGLCPGDDESQRGFRVCDVSGHGRHLIIGRSSGVFTLQWLEEGDTFLSETVRGILGEALGITLDYLVTEPSFTISNTPQASLEFLVYPVQFTTGVRHSLFFSRHFTAPLNIKRLWVQYDGDTGSVYFTTNISNDPNGGHSLVSSQSLQLHRWNHIVCTFGPTGRKIYVNGALSASDGEVISLGDYPSGDGMLGWDQDTGHLFGVLDEVVLYNRELSEDTIDNLFRAHY